MSDTSRLETIPISSLNALEYCPRSFYYQVVQGETLVNEFVLEGQLAQRAYSTLRAGAVPGRATAGQTAHRLWLHLLHRVAATGTGAIHAAVALQDESSHRPGVSGGSP